MEPVVPVTSLVASVTATVLEAARQTLAGKFDWPDTATGFAHYICVQNGVTPPAFMEEPHRATTAGMLRRIAVEGQEVVQRLRDRGLRFLGRGV